MSNLPGQRDAAAFDPPPRLRCAAPDVVIRPAAGPEIHAALRLILSSPAHRASDTDINDFLSFAGQRHIDLASLWIALRRGRMVFAALPVLSPGRTMLLLSPPHVPTAELDTSAAPLVAALAEHFSDRGVQLAQALVDPSHSASLRLHECAGFVPLAELIYLHRDVHSGAAAWPALPPQLHWETYSSATHALFARTIAASYEQSLDCPALNGVRDIEDVLAGHKAAGEFTPALWFLLVERHAGASADDPIGRGVLLLSRSARGDALELIYLGLPPEVRGRGLGALLMQQALSAVAATGSGGLSLAVDARNGPALRLYYRHGMHRVASWIALMRNLSDVRYTTSDASHCGGATAG